MAAVQEARGQDWIPAVDTFGSRLALVRQKMGWTNIKEAALACGVPPQTWRNWEFDWKRPRDLYAAAQSVSRATGVNAAWLAGFGDAVSSVPTYGEPSARVSDQELSSTSRYRIRDATVTECSSRGMVPCLRAAA